MLIFQQQQNVHMQAFTEKHLAYPTLLLFATNLPAINNELSLTLCWWSLPLRGIRTQAELSHCERWRNRE